MLSAGNISTAPLVEIMKKLLALTALVVVASGCTQLEGQDSSSKLLGDVSDKRITSSDPGEITLNAKNNGNSTRTYIVELYPAGDYNEVVEIYNREGQRRSAFRLGEAVAGATSGQRFAVVRKKLNISSTVRVKAELYTEQNDTVLDSRTFKLRTVEKR